MTHAADDLGEIAYERLEEEQAKPELWDDTHREQQSHIVSVHCRLNAYLSPTAANGSKDEDQGGRGEEGLPDDNGASLLLLVLLMDTLPVEICVLRVILIELLILRRSLADHGEELLVDVSRTLYKQVWLVFPDHEHLVGQHKRRRLVFLTEGESLDIRDDLEAKAFVDLNEGYIAVAEKHLNDLGFDGHRGLDSVSRNLH